MTSQRMMPPKMLTRMPFDVRVGQDDLERLGDLLLGGAAADVEEVGRLAAVELDDVHRRHRQAGAVDQAADVAVELDVAQVVLAGLELRRVFLVHVAQLPMSGWRNRALSSKLILASSASTSPASVTTSGLISTSEQSSVDEGLVQRRR